MEFFAGILITISIGMVGVVIIEGQMSDVNETQNLLCKVQLNNPKAIAVEQEEPEFIEYCVLPEDLKKLNDDFEEDD